MVRKVLLTMALSVVASLFAIAQQTQLPQDETGKVVYEAVVHREGLSADSLQKLAIKWIHSFYKNPSAVIKENKPGIIRVEHKFEVFDVDEKTGKRYKAGRIKYTLVIKFKDGRYKYELTDFKYIANRYIAIEEWLNSKDPKHQEYLRQVNEFATNLISNLREFIKNPPVQKEEEDW
ncbi:MAG: DUF4468 domain-containing protein [Chlorobi bacterium]|nr:DUF4468 domain-containing protein [Chlorobiota bacterium]